MFVELTSFLKLCLDILLNHVFPQLRQIPKHIRIPSIQHNTQIQNKPNLRNTLFLQLFYSLYVRIDKRLLLCFSQTYIISQIKILHRHIQVY